MTYVGDDGAGAYAGGVWTVPGLIDYQGQPGNPATLNIDVTVAAAEGTVIDTTATITASGRPDPNAANDSDTLSIQVNRKPTPVDDAGSDYQDSPIVVPVLTNDTDPDGDPLTLTADSALTAKGWYDCAGTSCVYWPNAGQTGADSFSYEVKDDRGLAATATVNITLVATAQPSLFLKTDGTASNSQLLPLAPPAFSPTAAAAPPVPDWNDGADGRPGMTLDRAGGANLDETSDSKYQAWGFPVGSDLAISGSVQLRIWSAVHDFDTTKGGRLMARLADCAGAAPRDTNAPQCTEIAWTELVSGGAWAPSGSFEFKTLDFGPVTYTVLAGRELRLKLVVADTSPEKLMLAFDTNATPAVLLFL